jgi:predicted RNA-binding protein YlxR (DUF448 family)
MLPRPGFPLGEGAVRTCIGCRVRTSAAGLLRVVAVGVGPSQWQAVPDPRRRAAGRGAWVHPVTGCVDLAERRRAFGRALHVLGETDSTPVSKYLHSVSEGSTAPSVADEMASARPSRK